MIKTAFPNLPFLKRDEKPRDTGINYVRSPVILGKYIEDYLEAYHEYVDIFKISGKQAALMSEKSLIDYVSTCKKHNVLVGIGNPVMDAALSGGKKVVNEYIDKSVDLGIDIIEISSIARSIDDVEMCHLIERISNKGIRVLNEIGVAFAHSEIEDNSIFINRLIKQSTKYLKAGCWKIVIESEGLTENLDKIDYRWTVIDSIISPLELSQFIVEADNQDILSKYIEIYGPKINMMIDHNRLLKMEAARLGFGPSQFLWGKVVRY